MPNLVGIFVSNTYLAIKYGVEVVAGCVLVQILKNAGSMSKQHVGYVN